MAMHSTHVFDGAQGSAVKNYPQSHWIMGLFAPFARAGSAVRAELRARRAYAELASLDDRMLRDIGISRSEIHSLVRRPVASAEAVPPRVLAQRP